MFLLHKHELPHLMKESNAEMQNVRQGKKRRRQVAGSILVTSWPTIIKRLVGVGPEGMFATRLGHNQHPTSQPSAIQAAMRHI